MKHFLQLIYILILLCIATTTYAQSNMEAKMVYQMAEEKFDAKQYTEALDYLEKAEAALGNTNPPVLFLKIMITNQIVSANESMDNYRALEKAITDFDKHKDKNALGEDKLMDVYRIKIDLDKRKTAYEKEANRTADLQKQYNEMVYRLAAEFPKTEVTVRDFITSVPTTWVRPSWGSGWDTRISEKDISIFVRLGGIDLHTGNESKTDGKFYLTKLSTYTPGEDRVKYYKVQKKIKWHNRAKNNIERNLTIEELCEFFNITPKQWNDFTSGVKPLIKKKQNQKVIELLLNLMKRDQMENTKCFKYMFMERQRLKMEIGKKCE